MNSPSIIAVYKTFRGHEFAVASLESIYHHVAVAGVLYVHSEVGWGGRTGNTVRPRIEEWCTRFHYTRVGHIDSNGPDQNSQYETARTSLLARDDWQWVMLIDTDEVWDDANWARVMPWLQDPTRALRTNMQTYIKSPFYRVSPPSALKPVVFVPRRMLESEPIGTRGSGYRAFLAADVEFHHFCAVRHSLSEVIAKQHACCTIEAEARVPAREWVSEVWNKLPLARDCLYVQSARQDWPGVEVVTLSDLPPAVRETALVRAWDVWPRVPRAIEIMGLLPRVGPNANAPSVGCGGRPLPPDFGPNHPEWNVPSKRNRWYLEQAKKERRERANT